MKTIAMYLEEHVIHVEVVLTVAMIAIAIAGHAMDVDYKTAPPLSLIGIAAIITALAVGFYYFKKANTKATGEASGIKQQPQFES